MTTTSVVQTALREILSDLNSLKDLPGKYPLTGEPTLQALANVHVAGMLGGTQSPPGDMLAGFCLFLDYLVQQAIDELKSKEKNIIPRAAGRRLNLVVGYEHSTEYKISELLECFDALKAKCPQAPWPVLGQKASKEDSHLFARYLNAAVNIWPRVFETKGGLFWFGA